MIHHVEAVSPAGLLHAAILLSSACLISKRMREITIPV